MRALLIGLGLLLVGCSAAPPGGFQLRDAPDGTMEITLFYATPEGIYGLIEYQGFALMLDMSESLRLQVQVVCDSQAATPPDFGRAHAAGLYKPSHQTLFAPICVFDGPRSPEALDNMAANLEPRGLGYVAAPDKTKRRVVFRTYAVKQNSQPPPIEEKRASTPSIAKDRA